METFQHKCCLLSQDKKEENWFLPIRVKELSQKQQESYTAQKKHYQKLPMLIMNGMNTNMNYHILMIVFLIMSTPGM